MIRARVALALPLLGIFGAACDIILDVPNPDEVKSLERVGEILCSCPYLEQQGPAFVQACKAGVAEGGEQGQRLLAESECDDCDNVASCYGQATGAERNPDGESCKLADGCGACTTPEGCESFACCFGAIVVSGNSGQFAGGCCDSCISCADAFPSSGDAPAEPGVCVESAEPLIALASCLCQAQDAAVPSAAWLACRVKGECPMPDPDDELLTQCAWYFEPCRQCLFFESGDLCQPQLDVCLNTVARPVGQAP